MMMMRRRIAEFCHVCHAAAAADDDDDDGGGDYYIFRTFALAVGCDPSASGTQLVECLQVFVVLSSSSYYVTIIIIIFVIIIFVIIIFVIIIIIIFVIRSQLCLPDETPKQDLDGKSSNAKKDEAKPILLLLSVYLTISTEVAQ